jgi:hypothetical protein
MARPAEECENSTHCSAFPTDSSATAANVSAESRSILPSAMSMNCLSIWPFAGCGRLAQPRGARRGNRRLRCRLMIVSSPNRVRRASVESLPVQEYFFGRRARIEDHEQGRSTQGFSGATNYARTLINSHRSVATSPPCERNRSLRINTKGHPRTDNR